MPTQTDQLTVFVSYSRAQVHFADELELYLSNQSHQVLLDRHGISKGENFQARLGEMILACDTVVFILSDESAQSDVCAWEIEEATRLSKRILVVTLSDLSPGISAPDKLAGIDWIHCWNNPAVPGSSQTKGLIELDTALRTDVHWLRQCTEYQRQAANWARRGKKKDSPILLRDDMLAEALDFAKNTPKNEDIPAELTEFFGKSAEYDTTLKSKALTRAKAVRQTGLIGAAVSAVFFLLAVGFGLFALQQRDAALAERNEATRQSNLSFSRALAAQATSEQQRDLDLSLLLSVEAFDTAPTMEARAALFSGLAQASHVDRFLRASREVASGALSHKDCALSFAAPTQTFAVTSKRDEGVLDIFRMPGGERITTVDIGGSNSAILSPDGQRLAYYTDTSVRIIDPDTRETIAETALASPYGCLQFNDASDRLFFSNGADLHIWDFVRGAALDSYTVPNMRNITRIGPSTDGRHWFVVGARPNGNQKITAAIDFDSKTVIGEIPDAFLMAHNRQQNMVAVATPTGLYTFGLDFDQGTDAIHEVPVNWGNMEFGKAALSPDGADVVIWNDTVLSVYDLASGEASATEIFGYSKMVEAMMFEPDGAHFITLGIDDAVIRWTRQLTPKLVDTLYLPDDSRLAALPAPFDAWLGMRGAGRLHEGSLEDMPTAELDVLVRQLTGARDADVAPAAVPADGEGAPSPPLPRDIVELGTPLAEAGYTALASLSPDRTAIAASAPDGRLVLLDSVTFETLAQSDNLGVSLTDLALLSPQRLLAVTSDGAIWQCDRTDTALACAAFAEQPPRISSRILAGTSPMEAYALGREELTHLDLEAGKVISNLAQGTGIGAPASASLDEQTGILAFSRGAGCVTFFDKDLIFPFGAELCPPTADWFVTSTGLAFNDAGDRLLSAHMGGIVLWDLAPETLIEKACAIANRDLTESEWARYMGQRPKDGACD